jgi:energy-coupling factor transporter ATP-binding protein EcfA2
MSDDEQLDVFLSHHSADKPVVEFLAQKLVQNGIRVFLDKWHLVPGSPWQEEIERALEKSKTCAVFLGPHGPGTWEHEEMRVALTKRAGGKMLRVFPVFLPGTSATDRLDLPPFLTRFTWVDFTSGLNDPEAFRYLISGIQGTVPGPPSGSISEPIGSNRPPYRGIEPFRISDADIFFGRDSLTRYLIERLRSWHFLALVGPSGSGKSSLVRAGLIPALQRGALPGSESWKNVIFRPGTSPVRELAARLFQDHNDPDIPLHNKIDRLVAEMTNSTVALATELRRAAQPHTLVVVDQFEEVFVQTPSESERQALFGNILDATSLRTANLSVVLLLRADFYASIAGYPDIAERIAARQIIVTPMQESELWDAITCPAERMGLRFEIDLAEKMLEEMRGQGGALPLMQQALLELWKQRDGNILTHSAYETIGGVKGSIARWANSVYEELSTARQNVVRKILLELIEPEGKARRRVLRRDLIIGNEEPQEIEETLEYLIQKRLLSTDRDATNKDNLVEIAHEALIDRWPTLHAWVEESRESRRIRRQLRERISVWERLNRAEGSLIRGAELDEIEKWNHDKLTTLSPIEKEYLEACREAKVLQEEKRNLYEPILTQRSSSTDPLDRRGAALQAIQATAYQRKTPQLFPLPDLEINIRLETESHLTFSLNNRRKQIVDLPLGSSPLNLNDETSLSSILGDISGLPIDTAAGPEIKSSIIADKGSAIWDLFPRELQTYLWDCRGEALSLLILSDEVHIPWEMARLQKPDSRAEIGPFLCEAFAVTRWIRGHPYKMRLPLHNLALVIPRESLLRDTVAEGEEVRRLAQSHGRQVTSIEPTFASLRRSLASGLYDGWHFAGHGAAIGDHSNLWAIQLDGFPHFTNEALQGEARNLGLANPLVFLNACKTGRAGFTLTSSGGWARGFLEANAGAFIGTHWEVADSKARELARNFYKSFLDGMPIGEAFRRARLYLHKKYKDDPTWLAYTVFAHPLASSTESAETPSRKLSADLTPPQLTLQVLTWRKDIDPPGALLRPQYRVVPFHHREEELTDLLGWCCAPSPVGIRLYTGPGGMGKTRIALELALKMREQGWWAGFVGAEGIQTPEKTWKAISRRKSKLLLIVDYAENSRPFLDAILREVSRLKRGPVRLLLLSRTTLDWWEQLEGEPDGVGELLRGPATSRHSLRPLADTFEARLESYFVAAKAFAERLALPLPTEEPHDLDSTPFQNGLLIHMQALIDVEGGEEKARDEDGILDRILSRERQFWRTRASAYGIEPRLVPGIGRALAAITLGGGVQGEGEAVEALRGIRLFENQPATTLTKVARLLHACYPGAHWIEPVHPDLLGEHLVQRELELGADELLDLVLGPRNGG